MQKKSNKRNHILVVDVAKIHLLEIKKGNYWIYKYVHTCVQSVNDSLPVKAPV